ncbi:amidase [Kribbella voronezhensis]|uniref:Amidase n=1 Tax=Kribbella voronezhensis TaxID=2512212 RepID=A0A4R7TAY8_9ACTN|nr:amidase [Kribbella voronezhensis]TDU88839.1 amidase [Kribbella voronezhensis]
MRLDGITAGRRGVLAGAAVVAAAPWFAPEAQAQLGEVGIAELAERMAAGRISAESLTRYYLDRIEKVDRRGPGLRAVIEVNPDAVREARRLDGERRGRGVRGPLHGLPVLIKDLFDTADRMHTTAGSSALEGARPRVDSTVAARLRAAGAVLLGKTNLSEWAGGMSLTHHAGWSARGGQTRNPYKLDRSPNESSSGSAVAAAADLCVAAIGTETNGSIVDPAAANSVVGVKPTVGLVGRGGMIQGVPSQDSVGPIARTVRDAAVVLGALVGVDRRDPATAGSRFHTDYTRFLDPNGLRGARIGVPREVYFGYSNHADEITERAIETMRRAGATIVDPADIPTARQLEDIQTSIVVQAFEVKRAFNSYLSSTPGEHPRNLAELIAFNRDHRDRELRYVQQDGLEAVQQLDFSESEYRAALATNHRLSRGEGIDAVLRRHRLDALVMPTGAPPGKIDLVNGDSYLGSSSLPAALAGYPAISVPAGFTFGLPVGITFMGTAWSEPVLLKLAYAFEQHTHARRTPTYLPGEVGF